MTDTPEERDPAQPEESAETPPPEKKFPGPLKPPSGDPKPAASAPAPKPAAPSAPAAAPPAPPTAPAPEVPASQGNRLWKILGGSGIGIVVLNSLLLAWALLDREHRPAQKAPVEIVTAEPADSKELMRMAEEIRHLRRQLGEVTKLQEAEDQGQMPGESVRERRLLADLDFADGLHAQGDWVGAKQRYYDFIARAAGLPYERQGLASKAYFRIVDCEREIARDALGVSPQRLPRAVVDVSSPTFSNALLYPPPRRPDVTEQEHHSFRGATGAVVQRVTTEEAGIFLYSVRAGRVDLREVLEVLAEAADRQLAIEPWAEGLVDEAICEVDLPALPFDRVSEIVLGCHGLESPPSVDRLTVRKVPTAEDRDVDWLERATRLYTRARLAYLDSPDIPRQATELARLELALDRFSEVIRILEPLMGRYQDAAQAPEMMWFLGRARLGLDDYLEARTIFSKLERTFPDSPIVPDAMTWKARAYLEDGGDENLQRAGSVLRYLLRKYPKAPTIPAAQAVLAEVYLATGTCDGAVELVLGLNGRIPEDKRRDLLLMASECLIQSGSPAQAIAQLLKIQKDPDDRGEYARAQVLLAEAYLDHGDLIDALYAGKRAENELATGPLRMRALLALGRAARQLGLAEDAERYLELALQSGGFDEPWWPEALAEQARLYDQQGLHERAALVWTKLFEQPGFEAISRLGAAKSRERQGERERAIAIAKAGLQYAKAGSAERRELLLLIGDASIALRDMTSALRAFSGEIQ
ncbi:MAG: tetratricopeptide repeat protein [Planctomycetota bacterium]